MLIVMHRPFNSQFMQNQLIYFIYRSYNQMSLSNPEYHIDSLTLKSLKQRVLRQAYQQELNKKTQRTTNSTNREPSEQDSPVIRANRSLGDLSLRPPTGTAAERTSQYPQARSMEKRETDRRRLIEETDLLSSVERQLSLQQVRRREARDEYKRHLQQEIKRKQSMRELRKVEDQKIEQSKMNREDSYRNKKSSFREFYQNAYKMRDSVANGYLQFVSSSKQSKQREKEKERMDLQQNCNLLKVQMLEQHRAKREKREQLKRALQQQMMESNTMKAYQLAQFKNRGYVKLESNNYNPIYNPIDYKMDLKNRYIIGQILPP